MVSTYRKNDGVSNPIISSNAVISSPNPFKVQFIIHIVYYNIRVYTNQLIPTKEVVPIEVRINKEVRDYQESVFFGLSLRQLIFALLAVLVAVGVYFGLRNIVGAGDVGWMCILAAFPFAMGGFFTYNGMTFEKFLLALIRSELLYPRKLVFRTENLYAKALENSSTKEALHLD